MTAATPLASRPASTADVGLTLALNGRTESGQNRGFPVEDFSGLANAIPNLSRLSRDNDIAIVPMTLEHAGGPVLLGEWNLK